ncbi:MAG: NADH-quinone oxidoreductase subunit NuoE family protein, partial [Candidatus Aminicenantales bacterium]
PEALRHVAKALGMPLIDVVGVATFYRAFSLEPRGKHTCLVCLGTACHVRGGPKILEELERKLDVPAGETTKDGQFTLETVACLGCCAIGPVVVVDGEYHGHATIRKIGPILSKYQKPEAS